MNYFLAYMDYKSFCHRWNAQPYTFAEWRSEARFIEELEMRHR